MANETSNTNWGVVVVALLTVGGWICFATDHILDLQIADEESARATARAKARAAGDASIAISPLQNIKSVLVPHRDTRANSRKCVRNADRAIRLSSACISERFHKPRTSGEFVLRRMP